MIENWCVRFQFIDPVRRAGVIRVYVLVRSGFSVCCCLAQDGQKVVDDCAGFGGRIRSGRRAIAKHIDDMSASVRKGHTLHTGTPRRVSPKQKHTHTHTKCEHTHTHM